MKIIYSLSFLFCASFLLSACASQTQTPATGTATSAPIIATPTAAVSCSAVSVMPTPVLDNSVIPAVSGADFSIGPTDAAVTLIEYCDFQSAGCAEQAQIIDALLKNHELDLRFIFRPLALAGALDKSDKAFMAAISANEQGKFWDMYNLLFAKQAEWTTLPPKEFEPWLLKESAALGMDAEQLSAGLNAPETRTKMISTMEAIKKLNLPAIPLILINGTLQPSYLLDYPSLNDTVGLIALGQKQFSQCPPFMVDTAKNYVAMLHTEKGAIVIQLFAKEAPLAVNSFIFLAKENWFDNAPFHRVIPGFVAQSGDPSGTGRGNPGYFFKTELSALMFDAPGMVGMANSGPDTNGSQFFITFAPEPSLNGKYTIFGKVISGLEVAESLTPRNPAENPNAPNGDKILSVEIKEQ